MVLCERYMSGYAILKSHFKGVKYQCFEFGAVLDYQSNADRRQMTPGLPKGEVYITS